MEKETIIDLLGEFYMNYKDCVFFPGTRPEIEFWELVKKILEIENG